MNNSKIAMDSQALVEDEIIDTTPFLRQKEAELVKIIEALNAISSSDYWKVLKQMIFDGVVDELYRRLSHENEEKEMLRLQGQVKWAEKYADLSKLTVSYRNQLENVRKQLTQRTEPFNAQEL